MEVLTFKVCLTLYIFVLNLLFLFAHLEKLQQLAHVLTNFLEGYNIILRRTYSPILFRLDEEQKSCVIFKTYKRDLLSCNTLWNDFIILLKME